MDARYKNLILALIVLLIGGAIFLLEGRKTERVADGSEDSQIEIISNEEKAKMYEEAKEISSPDGFINTAPITISELIGKKVILVDFWTYSCINCQRTLPYLNQWYEKYEDQGLEIIGLHTPEFEFEKDYQNVLRATQKFDVKYPVVLDNDYSTWTAYRNRYWPRKYLIDIDGFIVYDHIGEGGYEETEAKIVELLNERKVVLGESDMVALSLETPDDVQDVDFGKVRSPETYLGWSRSEYLANLPSADCRDKSCTYILPEELSLGAYVLGGDWTFEKENIVLDSSAGVIGIGFSASKVNLVAEAPKGASAEIWLDGKKIDEIEFDTADLYNLVDLEGEYGEHILEIRIEGQGFSAFAFTFG